MIFDDFFTFFLHPHGTPAALAPSPAGGPGRAMGLPRASEGRQKPHFSIILPTKNALKNQFKVLDGIASKTDSSFLGAVNAQKKKQFNGIDKLEKRLLKAQRRKMSLIENDLKNLYNEIYPDDIFQERKLNFIDIYLRYGDTFFKSLFNNIDLFDKKFLVLDIK